ncbi:MAG: RsmB/NOP family class I SAM-dependent RNA methyltransferase [Promethearchaeota archaeon]
MIERYLEYLGVKGTIALLDANEIPLKPSIRVNTIKTTKTALQKRLEQKGFELVPLDQLPHGFIVSKSPLNLGSLHEYLLGHYYLQNIASMIPPIVLDPKPDEIVVDMCAAPGSKATQLAQLMDNKGTLVLIEKNERRINSLEMNLRRMGVQNAIVYHMDAIELEKANIKADKILLDAPCTGEGLIRQDAARKTSKRYQDLLKLSKIQKRLLNVGLKMLKSGGKMLYSTCSIALEENELVVDEVLKKNPDCFIKEIPVQYGINGLTLVKNKKLNGNLKHSQRLYPHLHDTIGFYLCLIEKLS